MLKRHAAFLARGDIRRRARDARLLADDVDGTAPDERAPALPDGLPPAARRALVLLLHGLGREEIRQVLGISDTALRQRFASLRAARLRHPGLAELATAWQALLRERNPADTGLRRAALNGGPARLGGFRFGFSDPDGNFFSLSSRPQASRQQEDEAAAASGDRSSSEQEGNEPC